MQCESLTLKLWIEREDWMYNVESWLWIEIIVFRPHTNRASALLFRWITVFFYGFSKSGILGIKILKFSIHQFLRAAGENFRYLCTSNTNHERFETFSDDFWMKIYEMFLIFPEISGIFLRSCWKTRTKNTAKYTKSWELM